MSCTSNTKGDPPTRRGDHTWRTKRFMLGNDRYANRRECPYRDTGLAVRLRSSVCFRQMVV